VSSAFNDDCYFNPQDYTDAWEHQGEEKKPPRKIRVTFFPNEYAQTLSFKDVEFWELQDLILRTTAAAKDRLSFLKLAKFGEKRTPKGNSLRSNANVEFISGIELDYDAAVMGFETAVDILREANLTAILYTSPSYAASTPKWRVILPTSRDLPPSERAKMVARVNGLFGGIFAGESFTLSQAFYFGIKSNFSVQ
jgi:hypothetical protein